MLLATHIFVVNSFDFDNMRRGIGLISQGVNPWRPETRIPDFYNPPFAILFLWPMLFATPKIYLIVGCASLFAYAFYHKAWVALAWFATNTILWLIAAGGIDMFVIGTGLLLLLAGDKSNHIWQGLFLRVWAYGLFMVKPQGGIFIVALYILSRRDWKGLIISAFIYGVMFLPLYPAWLSVLLSDPPVAQTQASHTLLAKFGPVAAGVVALAVLFSRRWKYWQLGGALAGILAPYGMPGLPIFLTLTGVSEFAAIPVVVIYSGLLARLTWVTPPAGVDHYLAINPFLAIYHLSMLGLALTLACISRNDKETDTIAPVDWIKQHLQLPKLKGGMG